VVSTHVVFQIRFNWWFFVFILLRVFCSPLHMDGHGSINCKWVFHIYIESLTYIQWIVSKKIWTCFFCVSLDNHKIVAWFYFFSICKLLLVYGLWLSLLVKFKGFVD
jgi:hypothetical protein